MIRTLEQRVALVRYYLGVHYTTIDEDFFLAWGQLEYALQFDGKIDKTVIKRG